MNRRTFIQSLAAGVVAVPVLLNIGGGVARVVVVAEEKLFMVSGLWSPKRLIRPDELIPLQNNVVWDGLKTQPEVDEIVRVNPDWDILTLGMPT